MIGEVAESLAAALSRRLRAGRRFRTGVGDDARSSRTMRCSAPRICRRCSRLSRSRRRQGRSASRSLLPHPFLTPLMGAFARGPAPGAAKLDPVWSSRMEQPRHRSEPDAHRHSRRVPDEPGRRLERCGRATCCRSATAVRDGCASSAASAACSSAASASATAATRWRSKISSPGPSKALIRATSTSVLSVWLTASAEIA